MGEKRKHDETRRFSGWLLVVAFMLGALAMLLVFQIRSVPPSAVNSVQVAPVDLALTATRVVDEATAMAAGISANVDPFAPTATHLVDAATGQAAFGDQAQATHVPAAMDPFALTATHIIEQVTATAVAGG